MIEQDKIVDNFWEKYSKSDYFERKKMIKTLPFVKILQDKDIKKIETIEFIIISGLESYFTDLVNHYENLLEKEYKLN